MKDRFDRYFLAMKRGAKQRGLRVTVTAAFLRRLYKKQGGVCPYSGKKISLDDYTASLDRRDNTKGYTKTNCQWVHKRVNTIKYTLPEKEFLNWCRLITNYQRKKK